MSLVSLGSIHHSRRMCGRARWRGEMAGFPFIPCASAVRNGNGSQRMHAERLDLSLSPEVISPGALWLSRLSVPPQMSELDYSVLSGGLPERNATFLHFAL